MKYSELFNLAYETHYRNTKGEQTFLIYGQQIVDVIEKTNIKSIDYKVISRLIGHFREYGNQNSTINRKLNTLKGVLSFAYKRRPIEHKPYIDKLDVPPPVELYCSGKDKEAILKFFEKSDRRMFLHCLLSFKTGIRIGNLTSLNDSNIKDNFIILYDTKNSEVFKLPMTAEIKEAVEELKELDYFSGWKDYHIRYRFDKAIKALKLNVLYHPHTMRHTFATNAAQLKTSQDVLQRLTGHKSLASLKVYDHYSREDEMLNILKAM